jgi:hypothetical protein
MSEWLDLAKQPKGFSGVGDFSFMAQDPRWLADMLAQHEAKIKRVMSVVGVISVSGGVITMQGGGGGKQTASPTPLP